jgi:hypothetical protein
MYELPRLAEGYITLSVIVITTGKHLFPTLIYLTHPPLFNPEIISQRD